MWVRIGCISGVVEKNGSGTEDEVARQTLIASLYCLRYL